MTEAIAPAPAADNAGSVTTEAVTTTTSPPPADVPVNKPEGNVADWRSALPEDIRGNPTLSKFTTVEALAKSYVNAEKMIGADKIVIPKEGDAEGWNAVYQKLGRPDNPDGYGFKEPEKVPEGLRYDPELDKRVAAISHKRGLNKAQAAGVREDLMQLVAEGATQNLEAGKSQELAQAKEIADAEAALKNEWGEAYEQRGKAVWRFAEKTFSPETFALLEQTGLANKPSFIKDLYRMGVAMQGEKQLIGDAASVATPDDLDAQIAKFTADNMQALTDASHPYHATAVKERSRLFQKRYG
jgi:hypothetical protein